MTAGSQQRGALAALVPAASRVVPRHVIKWIAGQQFRTPFVARALALVVKPLTRIDTSIQRGAGAGLRFNAAGANLGYVLGTTEPDVQRVLAELCRPNAIVLDVGANVGFFTMIAARAVGPAGRVVGFDPVLANLAALKHNATLNGFANVEVHEVALGAADGEAQFLVGNDSTKSRMAGSGSITGGGTPTIVSVKALDALIAGGAVPVPDVIKMDVEGAEIEAVLGMRQTLTSHRPTLLCEMHGRTDEFIALMEQHNYEIEIVDGDVHASLGDAPWWVHLLARPRG